MQLLIY